MTTTEKLLLIQETSNIIESFINQTQKIKELESFLTFNPIYGKHLTQNLDLDEKLDKLKNCEIVHLSQSAEVSRLSEEVVELLKNYSSLVSIMLM